MKSQYPCQDRSATVTLANTPILQYTVMLKWKTTRRKRRRSCFLAALAVLFICLIAFHQQIWAGQSAYTNRWISLHEQRPHPLTEQHVPFWRSLHSLMRNNNPQCKKQPDLVVPLETEISFDPGHNHPRPDVLWLDESDIARLKAAHANFVSDVRLLAQDLPYEPGTRGIVTIATESLLPTLTISLRMLRRTSSHLPVEIYLKSPSSRSDAFCRNIFPSVNAKCFYLSDIFTAAGTAYAPTMHQAKILSLLFSTFEDVLFLDPCAFPLIAPEALFHTMPFTETGLIFWPDFWYASESPYYFDIAKVSKIPSLDIKAAIDSAEMIYSKSKHAMSLMLAAYYNFYGPEYYYLLQSQGGPGTGEKETFALAATALKESAYFVNHKVHSLGRHNEKGDWLGTAMIQFDPIADFYSQTHNRVTIVQPEDIAHPKPSQQRSGVDVKPMFVRVDYPKFDAHTIFGEDTTRANPATKNALGKSVRSWMDKQEAVKVFGFDLEERYWSEIETSICGDLLGLWLEQGKPDLRALDLVKRKDTELCEKVKTYRKEAFRSD